MGKTETKKTVIHDEVLHETPADFKPEDEMVDIHIQANRLSDTEINSSLKVQMHCHETFVIDVFTELLKGDQALYDIIKTALVNVKLEQLLEDKLVKRGEA